VKLPRRPGGGASRRAVPEGIRITTVGLWYVLFTVLVAIAATNTGNNALYMVLALMFAVLILSGIASRQNVRGLEAQIDPPGEVFANRPFGVGFTLKSRALVFPRWFLLFTLSRAGQPLLIPYLPRRGKSVGQLEMMVGTRGFHRFPHVHVSSLFPFGFFRKGVRYRVDFETLVFPELFPAGGSHPEESEQMGDDASRRRGWGPSWWRSRTAFRPHQGPLSAMTHRPRPTLPGHGTGRSCQRRQILPYPDSVPRRPRAASGVVRTRRQETDRAQPFPGSPARDS